MFVLAQIEALEHDDANIASTRPAKRASTRWRTLSESLKDVILLPPLTAEEYRFIQRVDEVLTGVQSVPMGVSNRSHHTSLVF